MSKKTQYWLMKSEPETYSIDDLKREKKAHWDGVRNYQARNYMRDSMKVGDRVLFYHSNAEPPGVAGIAEVSKEAFPDFTAWDKKSDYFDPRSTKEKPTWLMIEIKFLKKFPHFVPLEALKANPKLKGMLVIKKGMRLSVQPVEEEHFKVISSVGLS